MFVMLICSQYYIFDIVMEPESTVDKPLKWRIWHAVNYNIGGVSFLFGSLLLFPYMSTILPASASISAWLYTIGSLCFTFADYTQWAHYQPNAVFKSGASCCRFPSLSFNFFMSFTGSLIYLIGSALFLPQILMFQLGLQLFIAGSSFVFVSQMWKVLRVVADGIRKNDFAKVMCQDFTGVLVDLFAGLGGSMYFAGSIIFFNPDSVMQIVAAAIFSAGGFFFYLSGSFMIKRYFLNQKKKHIGAIQVASSQIKSEMQKQQFQSMTTN